MLPLHIRDALAAAGAPPSFANDASLGIPPAIGFFGYDAASDSATLSWPGTDPRLASSAGAGGGPSLYVVDGSLIEGSPGLANPSLTIAALAERCLAIVPRLQGRG